MTAPLNEYWTLIMFASCISAFLVVVIIGGFVRALAELHARTRRTCRKSSPDPEGWSQWVERTGKDHIPAAVSMADYESTAN